jgi:hypothetical protein
LNRLHKHIRSQREAGARLPKVVFIDARPKPSASKV